MEGNKLYKIKFVAEGDELCDTHFLICFSNGVTITFLPVVKNCKLVLKLYTNANKLPKGVRRKEFAKLAKSLGLTKRQLTAFMGFASSLKHWNNAPTSYWDGKWESQWHSITV